MTEEASGYVIRSEDIYGFVMLVLPSRAGKCNYKKSRDCLTALTWAELQYFRDHFAWDSTPMTARPDERIHYLDIGEKRLYGIGGLPQDIADALGCRIRVSEIAKTMTCLFVLGACWL